MALLAAGTQLASSLSPFTRYSASVGAAATRKTRRLPLSSPLHRPRPHLARPGTAQRTRVGTWTSQGPLAGVLVASAVSRCRSRPSSHHYTTTTTTPTPAASALPPWSPQPKAGDTVYIAMSGGVDSSVVALFLSHLSRSLKGSLHLQPIHMRNWSTLEESPDFEPGSGGAGGCKWQEEWDSVQAVCRHLQLSNPPRLIDLSREYWTHVFAPSLDDWGAGLTPNPDVLCNREIKFGALLDRLIPPFARQAYRANPEGPKSWLATGHYAKLSSPSLLEDNQELELHRATHRFKDQSYFLSSVPSSSFAHTLFPLAEIEKDQVRRMAKEFRLPTAEKKESMGLCFVGERGKGKDRGFERKGRAKMDRPNQDGDHEKLKATSPAAATFGNWLSSYLPPSSPYTSPGPIVSLEGEVLGQHQGLHTMTIGQGARLSSQSQKWFVARKEIRPIDKKGQTKTEMGTDKEAEQTQFQGHAIVVPGANHPLLVSTALHIPLETFRWISAAGPPAPLLQANGARGVRLLAQVRHGTDEMPCLVTREKEEVGGEKLKISFFLDEDSHLANFTHSRSTDSPTRQFRIRPMAICPGQVVALYDRSRCLGSAVIPAGGVRVLGEEEEQEQEQEQEKTRRGEEDFG